MSVARSGPEDRGRWQFGLLGWICWIVGAGVALGMARRARGFREKSGQINPDVLLSLGMVAVAVWLVIALILQVGRIARRSDRKGPAIAWRLAAAGALLAMLAELARLLAIEQDPRSWGLSPLRGWESIWLVALNTVLLATGLVLALSPTRPGRRGRPKLGWLSVACAALVGLAIVTLYIAVTVYLSLLGIDHVFEAMNHRRVLEPVLWVRLFRAAPAVALAAGACLATALVAGRDRFGGDGDSGLSWRWIVPRLASLVTTAGSGAWLLVVTVPMIHPCLVAGVRDTIGLKGLLMLALGFGGLSIGLAARTVAPPTIGAEVLTTTGRWVRRVVRLVLGIALLGLIGLSILALDGSMTLSHVTVIEDVGDLIRNWLVDHLPWLAIVWLLVHPEALIWELTALWLMVRVAALLNVRDSDQTAPLDRIAAESGSALRFAWLGTAWAVVALTALPTLALGSLIAFHFLLTGGRANFDVPIPVPQIRSRIGR